MPKLPHHKAAALADRLYEGLRPRFLELVTEFLAEPGPSGLPPEVVHVQAARLVADLKRKMGKAGR